MTAGQRNCFIALDECLDRYSLDDVVTALQEHLAPWVARSVAPRSKAAKACRDLHDEITRFRHALAAAESAKHGIHGNHE